jgi:hypothetical protein
VRDETSPRWLHVDDGLARAGFAGRLEFDDWVAQPERSEFDAEYDFKIAAEEEPPEVEPSRLDPSVIVAAIAIELCIPVAQLCSHRRSPIEVLGREAAIYCAERVGISGVDIGRALAVSQQAVSWVRCRGINSEAVALGASVLQRIEATK